MENTYYNVEHINHLEQLQSADFGDLEVTREYCYMAKKPHLYSVGDIVLVENANGLVPAIITGTVDAEKAIEVQEDAGFARYREIVAEIKVKM